jgi:hypothetical protein
MHLIKSTVLIAGLFIAAGMFGGCTTVPAGHVGIVVNNMGKDKGVQSYTAKTGFFFYLCPDHYLDEGYNGRKTPG